VINVQAREITDELTSLVKQIDALVSPANPPGKAGCTHSFVVFLTDDPDELEPKVAKLGKEAKLKNTPLTLFDGEAGHPDYKIAKEAEVTVLMWVNRKISVNFAFRKGELNKDAVKKVVAAAKKHLATK
jgi:hypothetical protein